MVRALPGCLRLLARLAWRASPAACITMVTLQLAGAAVSAFGLLATADVLNTLLAAGPTPQRLLEALPTIVLVVCAYAARGLAESAVAAAKVELSAFDDPTFYETMTRARDRGVNSIERALNLAVELAGSLVALAAV